MALCAFAFTFFACENIVDDLNVTPNDFTEVPATLSFNHSVLNMAAVSEAEPARIAGMWSDQFAGTDRQYIVQDRYEVSAATFDEVWSDLFVQGLSQAQIAETGATNSGNAVIANLSMGLQAYYAAEAALMFGDVPFNEVNNPDILDPTFQNQMEVLSSAINMLATAADGPGNALSAGAVNQVLNSASTWGEFFDALRARYLLAMGDYAGALAAAQSANFEGPEDDVDIMHTTDNFSENLFFQFEAEQRTDYLTLGNVGTEQSTLFNILSDTTSMSRGTDDEDTDDSARLALLFGGASGGFYRLNVNPGGFFGAASDWPVVSTPEVQLIIAEAAARTGDDDTALEALNAARNYWDTVTGEDNYGDLDGDDIGEDDEFLKTILIEKYVSVFGLPTFYDIIRTDNLIEADMDSRSTPAQRFLYPSTEVSSNSSFPGVKTLDEPTPVFDN